MESVLAAMLVVADRHLFVTNIPAIFYEAIPSLHLHDHHRFAPGRVAWV
jgi:hypothetical protein